MENETSNRQKLPSFDPNTVRLHRMQQRITQGELAAKVGLSTTTICRIERGAKQPTWEEIDALKAALDPGGVSPMQTAEPPAWMRHRLRVDIRLENVGAPNGESVQDGDGKDRSQPRFTPITIYVPLEQIAAQLLKDDALYEDQDDEEGPRYERQR